MYGIVIQRFGVAPAIFFGVASLGLGVLALRRLGIRSAAILTMGARDPDMLWAALKQFGLPVLGAVLLILPGFLSNLAGLGLLVINPTAWMWPKPSERPSKPDIIELDRDEWRTEEHNAPQRPQIAEPRIKDQ